MSKGVPATTKTASNERAMHHAMPSALGGSSVDSQDVLFKLVAAEKLSIFRTLSIVTEDNNCDGQDVLF